MQIENVQKIVYAFNDYLLIINIILVWKYRVLITYKVSLIDMKNEKIKYNTVYNISVIEV